MHKDLLMAGTFVILAEKLLKETKDKLRKRQSLNYPQDNIFFVRALLEVKGNKYLVRWANFPEDEATWEPRKSIPSFILSWYDEDPTRLGSDIPPPKIKWTKVRVDFKHNLNLVFPLVKPYILSEGAILKLVTLVFVFRKLVRGKSFTSCHGVKAVLWLKKRSSGRVFLIWSSKLLYRRVTAILVR